MKKFTVRNLAIIGVLAALSVVLMFFIRIPFPSAPFLEYDPADIPILMTAFMFGPFFGFALTIVVSVVQGLTVSASSGIIGILMHIFSTGAFVTIAGFIYSRRKTIKNAVISLICGVLAQTLLMVFMNLIFMPIFMNAPLETVVGMIFPVILPFNLMKAGINAVISFFVYKTMSAAVEKIFKKGSL